MALVGFVVAVVVVSAYLCTGVLRILTKITTTPTSRVYFAFFFDFFFFGPAAAAPEPAPPAGVGAFAAPGFEAEGAFHADEPVPLALLLPELAFALALPRPAAGLLDDTGLMAFPLAFDFFPPVTALLLTLLRYNWEGGRRTR